MNLEKHINRWQHCEECDICIFTQIKVQYRGMDSADLLFVGEAPGDTELVLGRPFVGPAGKYLQKVIDENCDKIGWRPRMGFTNAIACAPTEEETLKLRPPSKTELSNCRPRLFQLIGILKPKCIVTLGNVAKLSLSKLDMPGNIEVWNTVHPSAILRQGERGGLDAARLDSTIHEALIQLKQDMFG